MGMEDEGPSEEYHSRDSTSRKRTYDQMSREDRRNTPSWLRSSPNFYPHAPSTSLNLNFPPPPITRFPGDGLDFRRPIMSQPQVDNRDVIDLTGEPDTPPRVDSSSHHLHQSGRGARESQAAAQEIIDVDELDDRFDNIDSNLDNTSSDIELVSVRPRTQSVYPQRDRNSHTNPAMLAVPGRRRGLSAMRAISHRLAGLQGFLPTASATSQNRHIPPPRHRHFPASFILDTQIPRRLDEDDDEDDEFHISPHDFRVPNPDFETAAFQIGQEAALPTMPTYIAPPLAKEGFTRSPPEDSVLVCPNCDEELGMGEDELKRQVWIVRSCGHVYCGQCTKHRSKRSKTLRTANSKPFARCVVDGCGKVKVTGTKSMVQLYI